jgi:diguanylate cyclase (GGDEF)-like protein
MNQSAPTPFHGAIPAPLPYNETLRLNELNSYGILDSSAEQDYDDIVAITSAICRTPIAAVTFIDDHRQWFKSIKGFDLAEVPREISLCGYTILQPDRIMEVPDTLTDQRFATHPIVVNDPKIRFYASVPMVNPRGAAVGTICIMDHEPRNLSNIEIKALQSLSRQVITHLELKIAVTGLQRDGMTDFLTSVWNRRAFDRRLIDEWNLHLYGQKIMAIIMVDLDHFKKINDTYGHQAGDDTLAHAAKILEENVRQQDMVARYGGEEFVIILSNTDHHGAMAVAEKIRSALEQTDWPHTKVTASLGLASHSPQNGGSATGLLACADQALYIAKRTGRNRVEAFITWTN